MQRPVRSLLWFVLFGAASVCGPAVLAAERPENPPPQSIASGATALHADKVSVYSKRFDRVRPVIAVLAENSGTELTDFVIPYGVLAQSGVAEVVAVATNEGPINMRPALRIQPHATMDQFDTRFPEGADYVIVPAVVRHEDPKLLAWIVAQASKGGTLVSICDGALVLGNAGVLRNHRATGHWATQSLRTRRYPETQWLKNVRYVADGRIVTSAGIGAAMPTSLALVEAIAGTDVATSLANQLGVADWSARHDSDRFRPRFGVNLSAFARTIFTNGWFHSTRHIGVPVTTGVDEIALALTADAYSRTGRSHAVSVSASSAAVQTRNGLMVLPDRVVGDKQSVDSVLPPFDGTPSAQTLDKALAGIAESFGRSTAYGVALDFEYPGFQRRLK